MELSRSEASWSRQTAFPHSLYLTTDVTGRLQRAVRILHLDLKLCLFCEIIASPFLEVERLLVCCNLQNCDMLLQRCIDVDEICTLHADNFEWLLRSALSDDPKRTEKSPLAHQLKRRHSPKGIHQCNHPDVFAKLQAAFPVALVVSDTTVSCYFLHLRSHSSSCRMPLFRFRRGQDFKFFVVYRRPTSGQSFCAARNLSLCLSLRTGHALLHDVASSTLALGMRAVGYLCFELLPRDSWLVQHRATACTATCIQCGIPRFYTKRASS